MCSHVVAWLDRRREIAAFPTMADAVTTNVSAVLLAGAEGQREVPPVAANCVWGPYLHTKV